MRDQLRAAHLGEEARKVKVSAGFGGGLTRARMIPRIAFTSRDDQPVLVKMVRMVFLVAWVREGGWK